MILIPAWALRRFVGAICQLCKKDVYFYFHGNVSVQSTYLRDVDSWGNKILPAFLIRLDGGKFPPKEV